MDAGSRDFAICNRRIGGGNGGRHRHCERKRRSSSHRVKVGWIASSLALLAMTSKYAFTFSPRLAPEVCWKLAPLKTEGAGKTGCALHPRSRVQLCIKECAHEHTGPAESIRPSLRNGFTTYFVLSPANGSFATVIPKRREPLKNLTPAPRRQDHT